MFSLKQEAYSNLRFLSWIVYSLLYGDCNGTKFLISLGQACFLFDPGFKVSISIVLIVDLKSVFRTTKGRFIFHLLLGI